MHTGPIAVQWYPLTSVILCQHYWEIIHYATIAGNDVVYTWFCLSFLLLFRMVSQWQFPYLSVWTAKTNELLYRIDKCALFVNLLHGFSAKWSENIHWKRVTPKQNSVPCSRCCGLLSYSSLWWETYADFLGGIKVYIQVVKPHTVFWEKYNNSAVKFRCSVLWIMSNHFKVDK